MSDPYDIENSELMDMSTPSLRKKKVIVTVIVLLLVVVLAVTSALVVKFYVISTFVVQGTSMWPTLDGGAGAQDDNDLANGEILYLNKLAEIKRGDIIVCTPDWEFLKDKNGDRRSIVKRVIGVAGDTVEVRDNKVYLNGEPLDEPYINGVMDAIDGKWTVGDGEIFCMGDNRNNSLDSRVGGPIPLSKVEGKCFLIKGINGKLRTP